MISKLIPTGLIHTVKNDIQVLSKHFQNKNKVDENGELHKTDTKVHDAAWRVLGALGMIFSAVLASYTILSIFSIKLCLLTCTSVSAYVIGHDVFRIAKNKQKLEIPTEEIQFSQSLKVDSGLVDKVTKKTYIPTFWKEVLIKKEQVAFTVSTNESSDAFATL